jgi:dinuclear metal center YbgI/SA1388 family protein
MILAEVIALLEAEAPLCYQEDYDNSGLQTGDRQQEIHAALVCLDVTEEVIDEAIARKANLVVSHHPVIFGKLKKLTGSNAVERIVAKAIKNDIALYACHTNLDNVKHGVNKEIAERLSLRNLRVLRPKTGTLLKLFTYVPTTHVAAVEAALFEAGAGHIGAYSECSFQTPGRGSFKPGEETKPFLGSAGGAREYVEEVKIEVLLERYQQGRVLKVLMEAHPYEEVAYELIGIDNEHQDIGAGMIGELDEAVDAAGFLTIVKETMKTECIRHTSLPEGRVKRVAVCGGSGSFLLADAIKQGADAFVTADYKYHQFFEAEGRILIADIGHYESEQYTINLLARIISGKSPNFAVLLSNTNTNPVNYYY